jgi:hypothetical protein
LKTPVDEPNVVTRGHSNPCGQKSSAIHRLERCAQRVQIPPPQPKRLEGLPEILEAFFHWSVLAVFQQNPVELRANREIVFSHDDIPSPERIAEWQDMIDSLREYARKDLDRWERKSVEGIDDFLRPNGFLTQKQRERLEALHAEHLGD